MKKIFAAFILVFALSFPAFAEDFTIVSTALVSSDLFKTEIDDATSNDLIKLTGNYNFNTIEDALSFANDTAGYINTAYGLSLELADGEAENFPDVTIKLQSTSTSLIGSGVIQFSNYGNVTTIAILPNDSSTRTLNTPGTATRHFNFDNSGATVTLTNLTLEGNSGVGGVEISSGTVNFNTVTFQNIDVTGSALNGGAADISGGTVTFSGGNFTSNNAANGGAVAVTGGSLTLENGVTFTRNTATTNGGAILLNSAGSTLSLNGITFTNNNAAGGEGGAIIVSKTGGNLSVTDCTFTGNNAGTNGGAISIEGGSSFTFAGPLSNTFTSNNANGGDGGAIYIGSGTTFSFTGTNTFASNTATVNGGAIAYNTPATVDFSGLTFNINTANSGGGISVSNGTASLTNCVLNGNIAVNGGGLALLGGNVNVSGTTSFNSHNAPAIVNGGAVYVAARNSTTNIANTVTFAGNIADNGSIVYASNGTVNIDTDIISSTSRGDGGAVCASSDAGEVLTVNIKGAVSGNLAAGNGGAVYIGGGTVNVNSVSGDLLIDSNLADCGGAFYLAPSARAQLNVIGDNLVTFSANIATTGGGAIYAGANSVITFNTNLLFNLNQATNGNGGAIWLGASNQLDSMTGTVTFNKNSAQHTDTSNFTLGNGGAIYIGATRLSTVTLTAAHAYTFTNNSAQSYGGAIYTLSSDITFDSVTVATVNQATVGGGFASSATGVITLQNGTSVSNQSAPDGGAIYAAEVVVNNSKMFSNTATSGSGGAIYATNGVTITNSDFTGNVSRGTDPTAGGGAIYVIGDLTVTDSYFYQNNANVNGAAIFANNSRGSTTTTTIKNSYFDDNQTLNPNSGNGGAVCLYNNQRSIITENTFTNNVALFDGGALYAQGQYLEIDSCYFDGNYSSRFGGAIYFNQTSTGEPASIVIRKSMFEFNSGNGSSTEGGGGAVYIVTNNVEIESCTFYKNSLQAAKSGGDYGGALYFSSDTDASVKNSTFVDNAIENGADGSSGGGAIALSYEGTRHASIHSCTFTSNKSIHGGGAIYVKSGTLDIGATIAVGNTETGTLDINVDGDIKSLYGYNRIGVFGKAGLIGDFITEAKNITDRTSFPGNVFMQLRSTYFSTNQLAVNERPDLGSNIPPYIGSTRHPDGQFRLLTLMLSEDVTLGEYYRATSVIPFNFGRGRFPAYDERGVQRFNPRIKSDIGAVVFDGTRPVDDERESASYTIAYVQISGVPNSIRRVGQTAGLVAKIYYTNGRTAYGGNGANDEPVKWSATPAGYLKVNADTGVITAMRVTTGESYVTLKCETLRLDSSGNPAATGIARIKIDPALGFAELNNSPESGNSDTVQIIRDLRYEFEEYNMGYGLIDKNIEIVQSYNYADIISTIWGVENAQAIATTASNYNVAATTDNTLAYVVSVAGANEGDVTQPITYLCSFTSEELNSLLGGSYNSSVAALADTALDSETVAKLFSVLKIKFQGENGFNIPVLGSNSSINAADAVNKGALEVTNNGDGIDIKINLMVANVAANNSSKLEITESSNADLKGAIIIPDGVNDGQISGAVVFPQKEVVAAQENSTEDSSATEDNQQTTSGKAKTTTTTTTTAANSQENSSGGSSGCNLSRNEEAGSRKLFLFLVFLGLAFMKKIKRV